MDGTSHDNPSSELNDEKKDLFLTENGIKIIRIKAIDVKDNLDSVLKNIENCFGI